MSENIKTRRQRYQDCYPSDCVEGQLMKVQCRDDEIADLRAAPIKVEAAREHYEATHPKELRRVGGDKMESQYIAAPRKMEYMDQRREAFEAWAKGEHFHLAPSKYPDNFATYCTPRTQSAYEGFRAALAQRAPADEAQANAQNGGMHDSIFIKVWGDADGGSSGRIALANYAFNLGVKSVAGSPAEVERRVGTAPDVVSKEFIERMINGIGGGTWSNGSLTLRHDELEQVIKGVANIAVFHFAPFTISFKG